ncbi:hypothetical protein NQ317_017692 [Molorchus minor]|uniref:Mitochondrial import inner membrane translocase subunit TIM14 n=1 Tax=Molorchus minor TaxID=1323400 RepID=A0ABQ9JNP6_9CUCU|nr:hypothetical protein NQ317_017692 [Molorchus minor]
MVNGIILVGLGVAAAGFAGRYLLRQMPNAAKTFNEAMKNLPKFDAESVANSKYYKGGFDPKMNRREAALILGVSPLLINKKLKMLLRKLWQLIIRIEEVLHIWHPKSTRLKIT